jgi:hypothetical protein
VAKSTPVQLWRTTHVSSVDDGLEHQAAETPRFCYELKELVSGTKPNLDDGKVWELEELISYFMDIFAMNSDRLGSICSLPLY